MTECNRQRNIVWISNALCDVIEGCLSRLHLILLTGSFTLKIKLKSGFLFDE